MSWKNELVVLDNNRAAATNARHMDRDVVRLKVNAVCDDAADQIAVGVAELDVRPHVENVVQRAPVKFCPRLRQRQKRCLLPAGDGPGVFAIPCVHVSRPFVRCRLR